MVITKQKLFGKEFIIEKFETDRANDVLFRLDGKVVPYEAGSMKKIYALWRNREANSKSKGYQIEDNMLKASTFYEAIEQSPFTYEEIITLGLECDKDWLSDKDGHYCADTICIMTSELNHSRLYRITDTVERHFGVQEMIAPTEEQCGLYNAAIEIGGKRIQRRSTSKMDSIFWIRRKLVEKIDWILANDISVRDGRITAKLYELRDTFENQPSAYQNWLYDNMGNEGLEQEITSHETN